MRMRKPLAMIAALATLLGGMMFGATSAQAADGDADTVTNTVTPTVIAQSDGTIVLTSDDVHNLTDEKGNARQFKYVKLASYELTPDATTGPNLTLVTPDNLKAPVESAIKSLDNYANTDFTGKGDPLAWFASQTIDANDWRAFIELLEKQTGFDFSKDSVTPTLKIDDESNSLTFGPGSSAVLDGDGLYLFVDQTKEYTTNIQNSCSVTYGSLFDIIIGTRINNSTIANADGTLNINAATPDGKGNIPNGASEVKTTKHNNCYPDFGFTKKGVGADSDYLNGAKFSIKKLAANVDAPTSKDGFDTLWRGSADNFDTTITYQDVESQNQGNVALTNMRPGTYLIFESHVPDNCLNDYAARLVLTVTQRSDGNSANQTLHFELQEIGSNNLLTGSGTDTDPYVYKNIQNITQLPKTGAEGIALFFVVAALLAGAGATVFLKSRKTNQLLNR